MKVKRKKENKILKKFKEEEENNKEIKVLVSLVAIQNEKKKCYAFM